jgi:hypothetical protein
VAEGETIANHDAQLLLLNNAKSFPAAGYSDLGLAIMHRSILGLKKHFSADQSHVDQVSLLTPLELAVGWPEGLKFLVSKQCNFGTAFTNACYLHDLESVTILLSVDSATLFNADWIIDSDGYFYMDRLADASRDPDIFRRTAKELWKRREDLKTILLDLSVSITSDEPRLSQYRTRLGVLERIRQCSDIRETVGCFISVSLHSHNFLDAEKHQILYDLGFTDVHIDTPCREFRTPLVHLLQDVLAFDLGTISWNDTILWFLDKGADFTRLTGKNCENTQCCSHLQFSLATAMHRTGSLNSRILERCEDKIVRDACSCHCSSKGCIPPFRLWRDDHTPYRPYFGHYTKRLNCRSSHLSTWVERWKYSTAEKECLYSEICRLELFERLGLVHTCCARMWRSREEKEEI